MRIFIGFIVFALFFSGYTIYAQSENESQVGSEEYDLEQGTIEEFVDRQGLIERGPIMTDPNYKVEKFITGLEWPTTMTFVGNDLLVLEKNNGTVRHVKNGILEEKPVLDLEVDNSVEGGLLGIISRGSEVFLFYTEAEVDGGNTLGDKIYRYVWDGKELRSGKILMNIDRDDQVSSHHGGVFVKDLNDRIFVVTGDSFREGKNQNGVSDYIDDTSAIFDITKKGEFYSIGIRNSFGLTVDPITNNLWITENGPDVFDEVNLMFPKSNSGWDKTMGPDYDKVFVDSKNNEEFVYTDPKFSWEKSIGVTAISFINSEFFPELNNSILVGDFNNGNLYKFTLNENRDSLEFKEKMLQDLVAHQTDPINEIILGVGFPAITDIEIGPDGMIYVVTIGDGSIYRISPTERNEKISSNYECDLELQVNFSECDFSNLDLTGKNLSGKTFEKTNFSNSILTDSLIINSKFYDVNFSDSILKNVKLQRTSITNSILQNVDLSGSDMRQVIINNSNMQKSILNNVSLEHSIFSEVDMKETNIVDSNLLYAKLEKVILYNANLSYTNLQSADIIESDLQKVNLIDNNIRTATFTSSDLSGAKISGLYPYSSEYFKNDGIIFSDDTEADVCLGEGWIVKIFNRILYQIRQDDSTGLEFLEQMIINSC